MPSIRLLFVMLLSFLLVACGGGGSIATDGGSNTQYKITLELVAENGGADIDTVSKSQPGVINAKLTNNGTAFAGQLVTFTLLSVEAGEVGVLDPSSGTAKTDSNGVASIKLKAGQVEAAGQVTATYTDASGTTSSENYTFVSKGDDINSGGEQGTLKMTLAVVDKNGAAFTEQNPITKDNPGTVVATVTQDDQPVSSGLVSFTTEFTGKILSDTATQLISNGQAAIELGSGDFKGAGKVTANLDGSELTSNAFFFSSGDGASEETAEAAVDVKLLADCNDGWDSSRDITKLDPTDPSTGCTIINRDISSDKLGIVFVSVNNANTGDGFNGILVDVETTVGRLLPDSGNAVTDTYGIALLSLQPGTQSDSGTITATSKSVSATKSFNVGVAEISLGIDNGLPVINGVTQPLAAGATTVISVNIFDTDGSLLTLPLDVELTSNCEQAGKAELDAKVTSISGVATATYRALGCDTNEGDTVLATVNGKSINTNIPLSSTEVAAIEFISSSEPVIALKGTGGQSRTESSEITFKLKDKLGLAVSQGRIDFKLSSYNGGISLEPMSVKTNTEGLARTIVTSGTIPTAMRVHACYIPDDKIPADVANDVTCWKELYDTCQANPNAEGCPSGTLSLLNLDAQIISVSDMLTVTSGLPDNDSFTLSADKYSVEALQYTGEISELSLYLSDHFNNAVPDGTSVSLRAEGGAVGSFDGEQFTPLLQCETVDGTCNLQWRSQNPIPFNDPKWKNRIGRVDSNNPADNYENCNYYFGQIAPCANGLPNAADGEVNGVPLGGRATILATAKGEETYIDRNANGLFDVGEYYKDFDLPEAYIDNNENGKFEGDVDCSVASNCTPGNINAGEWEEFIDLNGNGVYDAADGVFNGLICTETAEAAGACSKDLIDIRRQIEIVMSGSEAFGRFVIQKSDFNGRAFLVYGGYGGSIPANCPSITLSEPADGSWIFEGTAPDTPLLQLEPSESSDYCDVASANIKTYFIHTDDSPALDIPLNCDREGGIYWDVATSTCSIQDTPIEIGLSSVPMTLFVSDIYNNPLPVETSVEVIATNGSAAGAEDFVLGNSTATRALGINASFGREGTPNKKEEGAMGFKFTTPKGNITSLSISVRDDG